MKKLETDLATCSSPTITTRLLTRTDKVLLLYTCVVAAVLHSSAGLKLSTCVLAQREQSMLTFETDQIQGGSAIVNKLVVRPEQEKKWRRRSQSVPAR